MEKVSKEQQQDSYNLYKRKLFCYTNQLMNYGVANWFIVLLVILESIQIIAFGMVEPLEYDSLGMEQFKIIANILYPDSFLRKTSALDFMMPIFAFFCILHIIIIVITAKDAESEKPHRLCILTHYFFIIINSILMAPLMLVSIVTIACSSESVYHSGKTCFEGYHIVQIVMGIICIVWGIICTVYIGLFYHTRNPFEFGFFSTSSNFWAFGKLLQKMYPPIFLILDQNLKYNVLYIVGVAGLTAGYLFVFRFMYPYYRSAKNLQTFLLRNQIVLFLVTVCFVPLFFWFDPVQINIVFPCSIVIGISLGSLASQVYYYRKDRLILALANITDEDETDVQVYEEFFYDLIQKVEDGRKKQGRVFILDVVKVHNNRCQNPKCACYKFLQAYVLSVEYSSDFTLIYEAVLAVIEEIISRKKDNIGLNILKAYIKFEKLGRRFETAQQLAAKVDPKISFVQEAAIFSLLYSFYNSFHDKSAMETYYKFSERKLSLQKLALSVVFTCEQLYKELFEQNCSITKIWNLVNEMQTKYEQISEIVENDILQIFPENLVTLKLYSHLLRKIFRKSKKARYYEQQFNHKKDLQSQSDKIKSNIDYRANSDLVVMTIRKNGSIFQIMSASSNVLQFLGYHNWELIGKNVNILLPKIYHKFHKEKMNDYIEQPDNDIKIRTATAYPLTKKGFIIQSHYEVKLMPSMDYGVKLLCFMNRKGHKDVMNLIYNSKTTEVQAMDEQFDEKAGLEEYEQKNLLTLLPEWNPITESYRPLDQNSDTKYIRLVRTDGPEDEKIIKILQISQKISDFRLTQQQQKEVFQRIIQNKIDFSSASSIASKKKRHDSVFQLQNESNQNCEKNEENNQKEGKNLLIVLIIAISFINIGLMIAQYQISQEKIGILNENIELVSIVNRNCDIIMELGIKLNAEGQSFSVQSLIDELKINVQKLFALDSSSKIPENSFNLDVKYYFTNGTYEIREKSLRDATSLFITQIRNYVSNSTENSTNLQFINENSLILYQTYHKFPSLYHVFISIEGASVFLTILILAVIYSVLWLLFVCFLNKQIQYCHTIMHSAIELYEGKKSQDLKIIEENCENFIKKFFASYMQMFTNSFKKKISNKEVKLKNEEEVEALSELRKKIFFLKKPTKAEYVRILVFFFFVMFLFKVLQTFLAFIQKDTIFAKTEELYHVGFLNNEFSKLNFQTEKSYVDSELVGQDAILTIQSIENLIKMESSPIFNQEKIFRSTLELRKIITDGNLIDKEFYTRIFEIISNVQTDLSVMKSTIKLEYTKTLCPGIIEIIYILFLVEILLMILASLCIWKTVIKSLNWKVLNSKRMIKFMKEEE